MNIFPSSHKVPLCPLPCQSLPSHPCLPRASATWLLTLRWVLPALELCINGVTQGVLLYLDFTTQQKKSIFRLMHKITCNISLFLFHCWLVFYYVNWFIYFPTNIHLDCFQFRIIINKVVMWTLIQAFMYIYVFIFSWVSTEQ